MPNPSQRYCVGAAISRCLGVLTGFQGEVPTVNLLAKQARLQGLMVGSRRQQQDYVAALEQSGARPVLDGIFSLDKLAGRFPLPNQRRPFRQGRRRMVNPETPPWPLPMEPVVNNIDHLVLNVADVEVSAAWYQRVLSMLRENFTPAGSSSPVTSLKFGRQKMNLRPASASVDAWFTARNIAPGSADLCFLTTNGPERRSSHTCVRLIFRSRRDLSNKTGAQGTLLSVYCRDPDGNLIEIASILRGVDERLGCARWC